MGAPLTLRCVYSFITFQRGPRNGTSFGLRYICARGGYGFDDYEHFRQIGIQRNKRLRFGFLLLVIGIAISLVSTMIK